MTRRKPSYHRPPPPKPRFLTGGKVLFALVYLGALFGFVYYSEGHFDLEEIFLGEGVDGGDVDKAADKMARSLFPGDCSGLDVLQEAIAEIIVELPSDQRSSFVSCILAEKTGDPYELGDGCEGGEEFKQLLSKRMMDDKSLIAALETCANEDGGGTGGTPKDAAAAEPAEKVPAEAPPADKPARVEER